jgi:N-acyl-D-aspartate/D-glutamate deacylase
MSLKQATLGLVLVMLQAVAVAEFELVIANGRVVDPASNLDAIRYVGIDGGSIKAVSTTPLEGRAIVDADGYVVAPGFIDIHSHTPSQLGAHLQVLDGVTTQLDLEAGAFPVGFYGEHFQGGSPINYGASVGHFAIRIEVVEGRTQPYLFTGFSAMAPGAAFVQPATPEQVVEMRALLHRGLEQGGLGIGLLLDYMTQGVQRPELSMIFEVAAEHGAPVIVHVRRGVAGDPAGLLEVVELAKTTGAAMLICHINHSAMGEIEQWLGIIDDANAAGASIVTETLSYSAGGTSISADVFNRNWQEIFDITYEDVQWTATGEWLTKETWQKYRSEQPTGMINHHYVKEPWMEAAMRWPRMMISSDGTPALDRDVKANPNVAGTFSRWLGRYVRDRKVTSLSDGLARVSLFPAQWLADFAPSFERKGRLRVGSDADIVVFDAAAIAANASYSDPYQTSTGIRHVFVNGRQVVEDGEVVVGRYPGRRILATDQ